MSKHLYTTEQLQFLKDKSDMPYKTLTQLFNERFGTDYHFTKIKSFCKSQGWKRCKRKNIGKSTGESTKYTHDQIQFILDNKNISSTMISKLFYEYFGANIPSNSIRYILRRNGILKGRNNTENKFRPTDEYIQFIKDNVYKNSFENLTMRFNEYFNTSFKVTQIKNAALKRHLKTGLKTGPAKGSRLSRLPIGSETVNDGFVYVRVSYDTGTRKDWRRKHILIWEKANGPLPKNHAVIFADKNKSNFELDNLVLVSLKELTLMSRNNLYFNDKESTKAGLEIIRYQMAVYNTIKKNLGPVGYKQFFNREYEKRRKLRESRNLMPGETKEEQNDT